MLTEEGVAAHLVILSSMLRGSRMKVGNTTRLKSAPGRSCEMIWDKTGSNRRQRKPSGWRPGACFGLTIALIGLYNLSVDIALGPRIIHRRAVAFRLGSEPVRQHDVLVTDLQKG